MIRQSNSEKPKNISIIVAEDEQLIRRNIVKKINEIGGQFYVAGEAHNGLAALRQIEQCHPDILITDVKMPVMDGLSLAREVQNACPRARIIIVTGHDEFTYAKQAIELGVKNYLLKPINSGELKKTLISVQMEIEQEERERNRNLSIYPEIDSQRDMVESIQEYLRRNFDRHVTMDSVARRFHISREYLSRAFKKHAGIGPNRFVRNLRIAAARKLLDENPGIEIKEVSQTVGYEDQGYFSRVFKKVTGRSPQEYKGRAL